MTTTTSTLPAPANGDARHSIVTLAKLLCVTPADIDVLLAPADPETGESPDLHSARRFFTYRDHGRVELGDCWLTYEAAERIAAELPVGLLARRVQTVDDVQLLGADQVLAIARHLVAQFGGAS